MKNKLTEQQLQAQLLAEFDAINKLGRGIGRVAGSAAKGVGAVAGGVAGLGSAVKKGYQAGKQTVGGGGANVNKGQPKQPSKAGGVLKNLAKNVGKVALDTAAGSGYDYRKGVNPNPTGVGAGLQKADAEAQRKAGLEKKLGTTGTQATATNTAKTATDKSIARNQKKLAKQSGIKQGMNQATAVKGATAVPGQTATAVPGQKKPPSAGGAAGAKNAPNPKSGSGGAGAQVDANKDGKDDKTGKPISQTAQNVGAKSGVQTAKIGGQKMDLNDPKMANMRAAIDKALGKGTTASIDKLDPPSKEKLKKALA